MSLQERTLVIRCFDPEKTTSKLLKELCLQAGPVRNVVVRPDHAFVEFEDIESVGYAKALLDGIHLFGKKLFMEPKMKTRNYFKYQEQLDTYVQFDKQQRLQQEQMIAYQIQQAQMHALMVQQQQLQTTMPPPLPQPSIPVLPIHPNAIDFQQQQQARPPIATQPPTFGQNLFNFTPLTGGQTAGIGQIQTTNNSHSPAPGWTNFNANNIRRSRSFNQDHSNRDGNWQDRRNSGRGRR